MYSCKAPPQTKEPMGHRKVYLGEVRPRGLDFGCTKYVEVALNSSILKQKVKRCKKCKSLRIFSNLALVRENVLVPE